MLQVYSCTLYVFNVKRLLHPEVEIVTSQTDFLQVMDRYTFRFFQSSDVPSEVLDNSEALAHLILEQFKDLMNNIAIQGDKLCGTFKNTFFVRKANYYEKVKGIITRLSEKIGVTINYLFYSDEFQFIVNNLMQREEQELKMIIKTMIDIIQKIHLLDENFSEIEQQVLQIQNFASQRKKYKTIQEQLHIAMVPKIQSSYFDSETSVANFLKEKLAEQNCYAYIKISGTVKSILGFETKGIPSMWNTAFNDEYTKDFGFTIPDKSILKSMNIDLQKVSDILITAHNKTLQFYKDIEDGKICVKKKSDFLFNLYNNHKDIFSFAV